MKRMKIKTEHAGAKNRGGWWGSRAEAKDLSRLLRRRNDKAIIEQEVIAMCSRDDDPTQHDEEVHAEHTRLGFRSGNCGQCFPCPVCEGPTSKPGRLCWYCDDEPDDEPETAEEVAMLVEDPYLAAILAADRDDPHIDYASEV